jgi:hypothetical protein
MKNCSKAKKEEGRMIIGWTYKKDGKAIREECGKKIKIQRRRREIILFVIMSKW